MKNNFQNLPKQMKDEGKFCLHENKIPKKRRYSKLYNASPNKKEDFSSYQNIVRDYETINSDKVGIGIGIFDLFCGIDIDHCINDKGEISDFAKEIIKTLNSYTEKSFSGTGIHIIFKCNNQKQFDSIKYYTKMNGKQLQANGIKETGGFEVYQGQFDNRYLTLTGNILINDLKTIDSNILEGIVTKYMKRPQATKRETRKSDFSSSSGNYQNDLFYLNEGLSKGKKLIELWNSTPSGSGGDESETDLKLLCQLAYWTNCNESLMRDSFEESPYFMQKDDEHIQKWYRDDYSSKTIRKALESVRKTAREKDLENKEKYKSKYKNEHKEEYKLQHKENAKEEEIKIAKNINKTNEKMQHNALDILDSFLEKTDSGIYKPNPTGFKILDEKTKGGISNQSVVILGGGTSVGKTTFIINLMRNFATSRPIVYYTLEMSEEQILSKLYSHIVYKEKGKKISNSDILQSYDKNKMTEYRRSCLIESIQAHKELKNIFIRFPDSSSIDFLKNDLYYMSERLKDEYQIAPIIVIDYLQFIQGESREDIQSLIKRTQRILKKYAIKENTIVFLLSANSREANKRKETDIDSGRDTSDIEYTSDYNLQLNFYEYEHGTDKKATVKQLSRINPRKMTITIHKQRFGERGLMIDYLFNGITNTFEELEDEEQDFEDYVEKQTKPKREIRKLSDM